MENRGLVNCYTPYKPKIGDIGPAVFTINLAVGVTPMMMLVDGKEYLSNCYRVRVGSGSLLVTHGWYRPTKAEFDGMYLSLQEHVLNGGLTHEPLAVAVQRQLPDDPTTVTAEYEMFQEWCLRTYGRRLGPLVKP